MTTEASIENALWSAADALRGSMDAGEYKNVILGMLFLKFASDVASARDEVPDEIDDDSPIITVPSPARWQYVSQHADNGDLAQALDSAMREIESSNPNLRGALSTSYSRDELDPGRLAQVFKLISDIHISSIAEDRDVLGRVYEYFLMKFDMSYGSAAGEFYTPSEVVRLLVAMVQPFSGTVYDPCCGSGGMFVQSVNFAVAHGGNRSSVSIFGQEFNPTTWKLAKMNLAMKGVNCDVGSTWADTFSADQHPTLRADYILSNPPYNISYWDRNESDIRWDYGLPPTGNSNFAWLQHIAHHLAPGGTAAVVMANGTLTAAGSGEDAIRAKMVEGNIVDAIVTLPGQLFYTTAISVCVWILSRGRDGDNGERQRSGEVLFIDARDAGEMASRRTRRLTDHDIDRIANTYNSWRSLESTEYRDQLGFCRSVTTDDLCASNYLLNPGRFVGVVQDDEHTVPIAERVRVARDELLGLLKRGAELETNLLKALTRHD